MTALLTHLRNDIRELLGHDGTVRFGDHDYRCEVELERRDGVLRVYADLASIDLWELPLGDMSGDDLRHLVEVVDAADARFGPLTGHCGWGIPEPTWDP